MSRENILCHLERISQNHYNTHLTLTKEKTFFQSCFLYQNVLYTYFKSLMSESVIAASSTTQDFSADVFLFFG